MQPKNWGDFSFMVELARAGSLALAARRLKVDATTLSRRITALENELGVRLFHRERGSFSLTAAGQAAIGRAERIEFEINEIKREVGGADAKAAGLVRISAPPWMVSHVLLPALHPLSAEHSAITLELIAEPQNVDVANRDSDMSIRMGRPVRELRAVAHRLTELDFGVYGPKGADARRLRWINFETNMADLPQCRWIGDAMKRDGCDQAAVLVNDSAIALHAVAAGHGKTVLPCILGDSASGVRRLSRGPVLNREVWLMTHPELRNRSRIRVVRSWLESLLTSPTKRRR